MNQPIPQAVSQSFPPDRDKIFEWLNARGGWTASEAKAFAKTIYATESGTMRQYHYQISWERPGETSGWEILVTVEKKE